MRNLLIMNWFKEIWYYLFHSVHKCKSCGAYYYWDSGFGVTCSSLCCDKYLLDRRKAKEDIVKRLNKDRNR